MYLWASLPAFRMEGSEIPLWFAKSSKGANRVKWGCAVVVYCDRGLSSIATDLSRLWWHRLVFITSLITPTKIRQFSDICKKKAIIFILPAIFFHPLQCYSVTVKFLPIPPPPKILFIFIYIYINIKVIFRI